VNILALICQHVEARSDNAPEPRHQSYRGCQTDRKALVRSFQGREATLQGGRQIR
jgi:hypothetical protein